MSDQKAGFARNPAFSAAILSSSGFSYFEHLCAAYRACALGGRLAVLHGDGLGVLDLGGLLALEAVAGDGHGLLSSTVAGPGQPGELAGIVSTRHPVRAIRPNSGRVRVPAITLKRLRRPGDSLTDS